MTLKAKISSFVFSFTARVKATRQRSPRKVQKPKQGREVQGWITTPSKVEKSKTGQEVHARLRNPSKVDKETKVEKSQLCRSQIKVFVKEV